MCARLQPNVPRWKGRCTLTEGCVWHARHRRKCKVGEIFYVEYEVEEVILTHLLRSYNSYFTTTPSYFANYCRVQVLDERPVATADVRPAAAERGGARRGRAPKPKRGAAPRTAAAAAAAAAAATGEMAGEAEAEVDFSVEYFVKWKGWPIEDATWEPASALRGCPEILAAWRAAKL